MLIELKILKVFCGDAILIRYLGNDEAYHNILIDGGYVKTYNSILKPEILEIIKRNEVIDILILSHYDKDHIGGILNFVRDDSIDKKLVKEWWLNSYIPIPSSSEISIGQLISLRDHLFSQNLKVREGIISSEGSQYLFGAKITILSPTQKIYLETKDIVDEEVRTTEISKKVSDYSLKLEELMKLTYHEDDDVSNKSSIAILFEIYNFIFLFLADALPSVIVKSLNDLGYNEDNKLKTDYVKLSHHGSKRNISLDLLNIIDCNNFIISSNGLNQHNLPDKSTLAIILLNPNRDINQKITFCINQQDKILDSIFKDDMESFSNYNFQIIYQDYFELN